MNESIKHHYVPRWYLKYWNYYNENKDDYEQIIFCFDKIKQKIIPNKGSKAFAKIENLYKSDITDLELESTQFQDLDEVHSRYINFLLMTSIKNERLSTCALVFFIHVIYWFSIRNPRIKYSIDISELRSELPEEINAITDEELRKEFHLTICKTNYDDNKEIKDYIINIRKNFYCFIATSNEKFITSDCPVLEIYNETMDKFGYKTPTDDDGIAIILFPITPYSMFVASRYKAHKKYHKKFVFDDQELINLNYSFQIDLDSHEVYFPYQIYSYSNVPKERLKNMDKGMLQKTSKTFCAFDCNQFKKTVPIIYSNWSGKKLQ